MLKLQQKHLKQRKIQQKNSMKVSYEYYVDTFKGKICQPEFEDLVEPVIDLVKGYAEQFIAPWALEKNIDYYCLELKRAV